MLSPPGIPDPTRVLPVNVVFAPDNVTVLARQLNGALPARLAVTLIGPLAARSQPPLVTVKVPASVSVPEPALVTEPPFRRKLFTVIVLPLVPFHTKPPPEIVNASPANVYAALVAGVRNW